MWGVRSMLLNVPSKYIWDLIVLQLAAAMPQKLCYRLALTALVKYIIPYYSDQLFSWPFRFSAANGHGLIQFWREDTHIRDHDFQKKYVSSRKMCRGLACSETEGRTRFFVERVKHQRAKSCCVRRKIYSSPSRQRLERLHEVPLLMVWHLPRPRDTWSFHLVLERKETCEFFTKVWAATDYTFWAVSSYRWACPAQLSSATCVEINSLL